MRPSASSSSAAWSKRSGVRALLRDVGDLAAGEARLKAASIADILEARLILEVQVVELACQRRTTDDAHRIAESASRLERWGDNAAFHTAVAAAAHNFVDGPVVLAAKRALAERDPKLILPYVKTDGEAEILAAFERTLAAHDGNAAANEVADLYFYEAAVRVHRAGEGAPYTGLKPAGLGFGPVVPVAERAVESGSPDELVEVLTEKVRHEVLERFGRAMTLKPHADESVASAREYVEAMLGLEVWSHKLYACASAGPHEEHGEAHEHTD